MMRRLILAAVFVGCGVATSLAPAAQAQGLPSSRSELAYSFAPLVKKVSPAVVNIYTTTTARVQRRLPFPFPGMPQQGSDRVQNSLGSGVLVRPDGLIVTNAHVVKGADEIRVVLADRREYEAKLITQDERYDLALLRIEGVEREVPVPRAARFRFDRGRRRGAGDRQSVRPEPDGDQRHRLGRGAQRRRHQRFELLPADRRGHQSRAIPAARWSRSTARLIGINTAIYSQSGGSVGIGFATPSNIVERMIAIGTKGGRIVRPWLGVSMQRVTPDLAAGFGLSRPAGLVVKDVYPDGPGADAGLKRNDVIVGIREQAIDDEAALRFRLSTLQVGSVVPVQGHARGQGSDRAVEACGAARGSAARPVAARGTAAAVGRHRSSTCRRPSPRRWAWPNGVPASSSSR